MNIQISTAPFTWSSGVRIPYRATRMHDNDGGRDGLKNLSMDWVGKNSAHQIILSSI